MSDRIGNACVSGDQASLQDQFRGAGCECLLATRCVQRAHLIVVSVKAPVLSVAYYAPSMQSCERLICNDLRVFVLLLFVHQS